MPQPEREDVLMVALRVTKLAMFLVVAVLAGSVYFGVASAVHRSFGATADESAGSRNAMLEEAVRKTESGQNLNAAQPPDGLARRP